MLYYIKFILFLLIKYIFVENYLKNHSNPKKFFFSVSTIFFFSFEPPNSLETQSGHQGWRIFEIMTQISEIVWSILEISEIHTSIPSVGLKPLILENNFFLKAKIKERKKVKQMNIDKEEKASTNSYQREISTHKISTLNVEH